MFGANPSKAPIRSDLGVMLNAALVYVKVNFKVVNDATTARPLTLMVACRVAARDVSV
jgi:hypothetical protein